MMLGRGAVFLRFEAGTVCPDRFATPVAHPLPCGALITSGTAAGRSRANMINFKSEEKS